jgi:plastocyanin
MRHRVLRLALLPLLLAAACDDEDPEEPFAIVAAIQLLDQCDPATFNAALGAGTCINRTFGMTFNEFNTTLGQSGFVPQWRIDPPELELEEGTTMEVVNLGGETHTFTEVAAFGGGIVPQLNQAAGTTTPAPECLALISSDFIEAGRSAPHSFDEEGDERYQCCIHPWMRTIVHVD